MITNAFPISCLVIRIRVSGITNAFLISGFVVRIRVSGITNAFPIFGFVIRIRIPGITNAFPISCFVIRIRADMITNAFPIFGFVVRIRTTIYSSAYESFQRFYDLISNNGKSTKCSDIENPRSRMTSGINILKYSRVEIIISLTTVVLFSQPLSRTSFFPSFLDLLLRSLPS